MSVLQRVSRLQWALAISIGVHAALLGLRIAAPAQFDRLFQDTPLEVILVNTRVVSDAPDKAQALAQTQLAGGGDQRAGRAVSPLPSAATTVSGDSADAMLARADQALYQAKAEGRNCVMG